MSPWAWGQGFEVGAGPRVGHHAHPAASPFMVVMGRRACESGHANVFGGESGTSMRLGPLLVGDTVGT